MTMEEQTVEGWYDYRGKQRCLGRILGKLGDQAVPGASDAEQYFRNLHRRNVLKNGSVRRFWFDITSFLGNF